MRWKAGNRPKETGMRGIVVASVFLAVTSMMVAAGAEGQTPSPTWPQWRGPSRDGQVAGPAWPASLQGDALKLLWRVELGPGYSGPIVAPDRVFTAETRDKTHEMIRALDRQTGKELWRVQ